MISLADADDCRAGIVVPTGAYLFKKAITFEGIMRCSGGVMVGFLLFPKMNCCAGVICVCSLMTDYFFCCYKGL